MHHHHSHATVKHTHKTPGRGTLINAILMHLHDTELWASHLPRVPKGLILLALFGFAIVAIPFSGLLPDSNVLKFSEWGLGILLVLPAVLAGLFAIRKWRYASRIRSEIFDSIGLRGDETVLDVGCGSGLLLNGAATRLTSGKAIGIDIWSPHSGGGNLDLLWKNAKAEGVANKIEFKEADARKMPFEDAAFDVILSSGALHHISHNFDDHERAVREMVRVLKPGGKIVLWDITHMIEATASKMKSLGIEYEVRPTVNSLGFDMSMLTGKNKQY